MATTDVRTSAWWDIPATTAAALDIMRLDATDPDAGRVQEAAAAACALIDTYLDLCEPLAPPTPEPIMLAAALLTVELYRRKDAPFGQVGEWSDDGGPIRIPMDWLSSVRYLLLPYKCGWGIA